MSNAYKTISSSNSNHSDDLYSHIVRNIDDLEDTQSDQTTNYYHDQENDDIENEDLNDVLRASVAFDPDEESDLYSHNINQRDDTDSNSSDFYSSTATSQTVSPAPPYSAYTDKKQRATSPYRVQPDLRDLRQRIQSLTASQYKHQLEGSEETRSGRTTPSPRDIYAQTFVGSSHSSQSSASSTNYTPQMSEERVRALSAEERRSRRGSSSLAPARSELSAYQKLQNHNKKLVELSSELLRTLRREVSRISDANEREQRDKKVSEIEARVLDVVHKSKKVKEERGERRDWNELFQSALDMPQDSVPQQIVRYEKIIDVAQNFERTAQVFGKIIISEVFLPYKFKTIKPVSELGGHAGGEKYIYNGILFKFAVDWKGIYSGDEYAMKAAGHEMRSLIAFYNYGQPIGLRVPLIALVNYLGFRLVALSILPVSRHTIVYGSCDGGQNVYKSHDRVAHLMKRVAKRLNLKKHKAGVDVELAKSLPYPCDIETHVGRDNRFYTLDFARLMPPTTPDPRYKESYLYQQFRPEFMKRYKHALSPDAFSPKFDMHEVDRTAHQLEISEATDYLRGTLIPQFAKTLDLLFRKSIRQELSNLIHREGINVRYLAVLRRHCQSSYLKNVIMIEMVARAVKNHLRHVLRETKKQLRAWGLQPYHEVVVRCFNQLLGHGPSREECALFWSELRARLEMQFEEFPSDDELMHEHEEYVDKIAAAVANDICTFKATGSVGTKQLWYQCFTCQLVKNQVVCEVCARKCHKNHEISPLRALTSPHYCECGSTGVFCSARVRTLSENGGFVVRPKEEENGAESRDAATTNHVLGDIKLLVEPLARTNDPLLQIDEDLHVLGPIKNKLKSMGWLQVFERIEELSGVKLTGDVKRVLQQSEHDLTFVLPDVQKILLKSRQMPLVTFAEANLLHLQSLQQSNAFAQQRLFDLSMYKFDKSVKANPDNEEIILAYAAALKQHAYRASPIDFKLLTRAVLKYQSIKHLTEIKSVVADLFERRALLESDTNSVYFEQYRNLLQRCYDILCSDRYWMRQRASLEFLSTQCTYLTQLDLSHSTLLNRALVAQFSVNCTELRSLRLKQTAHLNDELLVLFVVNLASLSVLELEDLPITDKSIEYICAHCPQLQSWVMRACSRVSDLTALQQLTTLRIIDISHCTRVTDLSPLKHCPNMEDVNITGCTQITEESLRQIIANCPRLSKLTLDGCVQVHDSLIKELVQQSICLEYISLLGCASVTDKAIAHLSLAPKLDSVQLDDKLKEHAEQLLHVTIL